MTKQEQIERTKAQAIDQEIGWFSCSDLGEWASCLLAAADLWVEVAKLAGNDRAELESAWWAVTKLRAVARYWCDGAETHLAIVALPCDLDQRIAEIQEMLDADTR